MTDFIVFIVENSRVNDNRNAEESIKAKNFENLSWFISKFMIFDKEEKKNKYRLINAALNINKMIIRNANLSPSINEFSKNFVECFIVLLIDFFSNYDQIKLDIFNRDMTAFMTSIELLRMIKLFQKIINSIT